MNHMHIWPKYKKLVFFLMAVGYLALCSSCRLHNLEKSLIPKYKEFLSTVRYIISKEERKTFLELPDSEKDEFIQGFWQRRDPDPGTEENEFKDLYFERIEKANRLFRGGVPGWLQDRGRIYILFGPPNERNQYPMRAQPMEIWMYGQFPVIFVDELGNRDFRLVTINMAHLMAINEAQIGLQEEFRPLEKYFDFKVSTKKGEADSVIVIVEVDLKHLWFKSEDDRLKTILTLSAEVFDSDGKNVWQEKKDFSISILKEDLVKNRKYTLEYPLNLDKGVYTLKLALENQTDLKSKNKSLKITI